MTVPGFFRGEYQPQVSYQPQEVVLDPSSGIGYQNTTNGPLQGLDPASNPAVWTNVGTYGGVPASVANGVSGVYAPETYGAKGDGVILFNTLMTAGSAVLNSTDSGVNFTSADVGKTIIVSGVGPSNDSLVTTIQSVQSTSQITLAGAATVATPDPAAARIAVYGTNDTAAIQAASDAAAVTPNFSGGVQFASKVYIVAGALVQGGSRLTNSQITLPRATPPGGGSGHLLWKGVRNSGASPALPFPGVAGTVIVSTLISQSYSATYGIPAVIGGPTQEQTSSFTPWVFDLEDVQILTPRNPSVAAVNTETMYATNRKRVTVGTLEWGYSQVGLETLAIAEPTHPAAAALIDPRTTNFQGGAGHNEQLSIWGYFAGVVPNEHTVYTTTRIFNTKIPLAVRSDANQRTKGFTHAASFKYLSAEGNPYLISGWDPTSVTNSGGVTSVPNAAALFLIDEVDIEDYSDTTTGTAWSTLVNHVNDTLNKLTGTIRWSRWSWVTGTFTKMSALVLNGGTALVVQQNNPSLLGWQNPTLQGNWGNYGSGFATLAYRKDPVTGMVKLKGNIKSTSASPDSTVIFQLPAGFRPLQNQNFTVYAYSSATTYTGIVGIAAANGAVNVALGATGTIVSVDSIEFLAEQ